MIKIYLEKANQLLDNKMGRRLDFYYIRYEGHLKMYFYLCTISDHFQLAYFSKWGNYGGSPFWPVHYNTEKCSGMIKDIDFILDNFVEVTEKFPVPEKGSIDWDIEDANPSGLPDNQFGKPGMLLFLHKLKWLCEKAIEKDEDLLIDAD